MGLIYLSLYLFCVFVAIGGGLYAAYSDAKMMQIPNSVVLLVAGAFVLVSGVVFLADVTVMDSFLKHLAAGGVMLAITFVMFILRVFGGGDAKLIAAYALWMGLSGMITFLFYTAVFGALLGIFALIVTKKKPFKKPLDGSWIDRLQKGEGRVAYGIAIAAGMIVSFIGEGYLAKDTLLQFLTMS
mgnify:FL=1